MFSIIAALKNIFRNKGKNTAAVFVISICFILGILMVNVSTFAANRISEIKEELGTSINLEVGWKYVNDFFSQKKSSEQYQEDPFIFPESVVNKISSLENIINTVKSLRGSFKSEDLVSAMKAQMEQQEGFATYSKIQEAAEDGVNAGAPVFDQFSLIGVSDLSRYSEFVDGKLKLVEGKIFDQYDLRKDVCIVSKNFADANKLTIRSTITINGSELEVMGIYENTAIISGAQKSGGVMIVDSALDDIYTPLTTAQKLLDKEGFLSKAVFTADSFDNVEKIVKESNDLIKNLNLGDKLTEYGDTSRFQTSVSALGSVKNISRIGIFGAFGAALIIIFASMFTTIRGRAKEIGILKAIGASNMWVIRQFLAESMAMCIIALFIGLLVISFTNNFLINNLFLKAVQQREIKTQEEMISNLQEAEIQSEGNSNPGSEAMSATQSFGLQSEQIEKKLETLSQWNIRMDLRTILYSCAFSLTASLLGTIIPAALISRLRPAVVLRFE